MRSHVYSRSGLVARSRISGCEGESAIVGLTACTDGLGRVWLAWEQPRGRTSTVQVSAWDGANWTRPATDPTVGLWVGWCSYTGAGFVLVLRHLSAGGAWEAPVVASTGQQLDLDPSLDVGGQGRVYVVWKRADQRSGTRAGYRFNEETSLYARVHDPAAGTWFDLSGETGRPLPIPASAEFPPIAGRESLVRWRCPLAPRIFGCGGAGSHSLSAVPRCARGLRLGL